jgi:hypothetical protein
LLTQNFLSYYPITGPQLLIAIMKLIEKRSSLPSKVLGATPHFASSLESAFSLENAISRSSFTSFSIATEWYKRTMRSLAGFETLQGDKSSSSTSSLKLVISFALSRKIILRNGLTRPSLHSHGIASSCHQHNLKYLVLLSFLFFFY